MTFKTFRRIVLWLLVAGVVVATLPWGLSMAGKFAYDNRDYTTAQSIWNIAQYTSFYDRDAVLFDIGDAQYRNRDFKGAATTFGQASDIAANERKCMIAYNWGKSLADHGASIEAKDKSGALTAYADALRAIAVQRCTGDATYRDQFEDLRQELLKKIDELTASQAKDQKQSTSNESANEIIEDHSGEIIQQRKYQSAVNYDQEPLGSTRNFKLVR